MRGLPRRRAADPVVVPPLREGSTDGDLRRARVGEPPAGHSGGRENARGGPAGPARQMCPAPAPAASAFSPRLVSSATRTATTATPAATRHARLMPEMKVLWATSVIRAAISGGVSLVTGAMPTRTA